MTRPTTLYRIFDFDGQLLYVGITSRKSQRFVEHSASQEWWSQVARICLDHYEDRNEAVAAEKAAISTEHPIHNFVGLPRELTRRRRRRVLHLPDFPDDLRLRLKAIAALNNETLRELVIRILTDYVDHLDAERREAS